MFYKIRNGLHNSRTSLLALASALLASHAGAQTTPIETPAAKSAAASPLPYKSAFDGYQAYSDDKMTNWKAANDEVARIGGWREYAKQAQQPESTPTAKAGEGQSKATP